MIIGILVTKKCKKIDTTVQIGASRQSNLLNIFEAQLIKKYLGSSDSFKEQQVSYQPGNLLWSNAVFILRHKNGTDPSCNTMALIKYTYSDIVGRYT
jgi:hypothetical protein